MFRETNGRYKKRPRYIVSSILIGGAIAVMVAYVIYFNHTFVFAERFVNEAATSTPAIDCMENIYIEECVKRFTDYVAETFADMKYTESVLEKAQELYNVATTTHQEAVDMFNSYKR